MSRRRTTLRDSENNIVVKVDEFGNCKLSDVVRALQFRIKGHIKFIERERKIIMDNIEFEDIVSDSAKKYEERLLKIDELDEILECIFKVK